MRVRDVAEELDQHVATIYRKIATGELRAIRLGSGRAAIRIPRSALEELTQLETTAPADAPRPPMSAGGQSTRGGAAGHATEEDD